MESILKSRPNFRDLGGISTKSGKKVKKNCIYRSGFIGKLDEMDSLRLNALNLATILDLRTSQEIDLVGKGDYPSTIQYKNIVLSAGNITKALIPIFEKGEFHLLESNIMDKIYFELITKFNVELATIYRTIANSKGGLVYHCSHGKDRTGIISALLLDFFEVDRDLIYADYLKSNELLSIANQYQMESIKANFTKRFNRAVSDDEFAPVKSLFYCRKEILEAVFKHIDNEYRTVANYFETELGLSQLELELLKSKYLE